MEEKKDPVNAFVVALLVSLIYIFGIITKNQKTDLGSRNKSIGKGIGSDSKYIVYE
jgi:hypothetical protein